MSPSKRRLVSGQPALFHAAVGASCKGEASSSKPQDEERLGHGVVSVIAWEKPGSTRH